MFDTVILDWSGTLVDDLEAVLVGTNHALRAFGFPEMTRDEFRLQFDLPVRRFYEAATPGIPFDRLDGAFQAGFRTARSTIRPLDSAVAFLDRAAQCDVRLMVLTTLDRTEAERQASAFGWTSRFRGFHSGVPDKIPHLVQLVAQERLDPQRTVFVGDLPHDIEAGRAAGVRTCGVLSGYATRAKLEAASPDFLFDDVGVVASELVRARGLR